MSLVHPDLEDELEGPYGEKTFAFVKKMLKKVGYIDLTSAGLVATGQLRNGDGTARAGVSDVSVRLSGLGTMVVGTGSLRYGGGTTAIWLRTNSSGAFSVTVTGTGNLMVEASTPFSLPAMVDLS